MLQSCEENLGNETAATESSRCCGFTEFRGKQGLSWPNPSKKSCKVKHTWNRKRLLGNKIQNYGNQLFNSFSLGYAQIV